MFAKRIVALLLTLFILLADSGQMLYAHTCLKNNTTEFSFFKQNDCCKKTDASQCCQVKKTSCCIVNSAYLKLHFSQAPNLNKHSLENTLYFLLVVILPITFSVSGSKVTYPLPPLLITSKSSNVFTGTFRI